MAKGFSFRWKKIVEYVTLHEYNTEVDEMIRAWSPKLSAVVDYVHRTWLNPYKEKFVYAWTKKNLNFGAETINRNY